MNHTFTDTIEIPLTNDPVTQFTRKMGKPIINIDTINKSISIIWHIEYFTPTGVLFFTTPHRQVADNDTLVVMATGNHITMEAYNAAEVKPNVMGEYDFWCFANRNSPFDVLEQVEQYGVIFAERSGWLPDGQ